MAGISASAVASGLTKLDRPGDQRASPAGPMNLPSGCRRHMPAPEPLARIRDGHISAMLPVR